LSITSSFRHFTEALKQTVSQKVKETFSSTMIYNLLQIIFVIISLTSFSVLGFIPGAAISGRWTTANKICRLRDISQLKSKNIAAIGKRYSTALRMSEADNPFYRGMDAYQILEIPKTATKRDVKSAYRKAVATWHPDKFPDDEEKKKEGNLRMEKINRAWFCLGDDDRRRRYDQYGEQGVGSSAASEEQLKQQGGPGMGGFGGYGPGGGNVDVQDISDIFDAFFGGVAGGAGGARGGGARAGSAQQRQRSANAPVAGKTDNISLYSVHLHN
jgi:hypothetical protein